jgi:hypothetical protein
MAFSDIAAATVNRIIGHLARRAVGWLLVAIFALAAVYQGTVAVTLALELKFGVVEAHLMIAAFYAIAAVLTVAVLWVTARRSALNYENRASIDRIPPELQIATIVEAMLLGYAMSRRK